MRVFFDSNILLYLAGSDPVKARSSEQLLRAGGWISVQVLNEIANVSRNKMRNDWPRTHALLEPIKQLTDLLDMTCALHECGLAMAERYRLSIWDGQIVAAALIADCDVLYSEDMHDGLVIDGKLRIENPFAQTPR